MAVVVHKRRFILMYNPEWFKAASYDQALAVIEHEICHLI
jgi:predicted SprT family Zn-dependent metalloprotease